MNTRLRNYEYAVDYTGMTEKFTELSRLKKSFHRAARSRRNCCEIISSSALKYVLYMESTKRRRNMNMEKSLRLCVYAVAGVRLLKFSFHKTLKNERDELK